MSCSASWAHHCLPIPPEPNGTTKKAPSGGACEPTVLFNSEFRWELREAGAVTIVKMVKFLTLSNDQNSPEAILTPIFTIFRISSLYLTLPQQA